MRNLIVKCVWIKMVLFTLILLKDGSCAEDHNGKLISTEQLRSYKDIEFKIYEKFKKDMNACAQNLVISHAYAKAYKTERTKNSGHKYRDRCNALIKEWWVERGNPIKINAQKQLRDEVYVNIGNWKSLFFSRVGYETEKFGFYNISGAYDTLTNICDKVRDAVNFAHSVSYTGEWQTIILETRKKEVELAEQKEEELAAQKEKEKVEQNIKAFPSNLALAKNGNANAQNSVGVAYYKGEGVAKDIRTARSWFEKSANQGNWAAMTWLAKIYYNSEGGTFEEDPLHIRRGTALKWYRRAADHGWEPAQGWIDKILAEAKDGGYLSNIQ